MISGGERCKFGDFVPTISARQHHPSKPKLFCQLGSSYSMNQKPGHQLVCKSPQLSVERYEDGKHNNFVRVEKWNDLRRFEEQR
ncbi:unnamed protein product [Brugia pahangi]|uniref:Uncharacterized protein n=1 Tax=Brugia pahangi TaxID=6280 RepID=A0A0N4SX43_BRUPA|nr:unnamed protein product [Brugia pahangi]